MFLIGAVFGAILMYALYLRNSIHTTTHTSTTKYSVDGEVFLKDGRPMTETEKAAFRLRMNAFNDRMKKFEHDMDRFADRMDELFKF